MQTEEDIEKSIKIFEEAIYIVEKQMDDIYDVESNMYLRYDKHLTGLYLQRNILKWVIGHEQ